MAYKPGSPNVSLPHALMATPCMSIISLERFLLVIFLMLILLSAQSEALRKGNKFDTHTFDSGSSQGNTPLAHPGMGKLWY